MRLSNNTYTPSIPDSLMRACGGNLNLAGMAARIAGFILSSESGVATLTISAICSIYPWSVNTTKSYIRQLQSMQVFEVSAGSYRGAKSEWRKGSNFDTFFTDRKGSNFDGERGQILTIKGSNFDTINKYKINNKYNNKLKGFACGDIISFNKFYELFGTTDEKEVAARGLGNWEKTKTLPIKYRKL